MKKKKQRGSALIVVMIFSLFFIVISSVAAVAVVNTFKANGGEENYQTLYYEAESGIEKAKALANVGEYDSMVIGDVKDKSNSVGYEFDMNKGSVEFSVEKCDDVVLGEYLQVVSTSKMSNGTNRVVKAKIRPWATSADLFKYSICGEYVETDSSLGGALNLSTSLINSSKAPNVVDAGGGAIAGGDVDNSDFDLPTFDNSRIPHINEMDINITSDFNTFCENYITNYGDSSEIKKVELLGRFTVYLINADSVKIYAPTGLILNNTMILTSGKIEIDVNNVPSHITGSSIIGKEVHISKGNITVSTRPYNPLYPGGVAEGGGADCVLSDNDLKKLIDGGDEIIKGISYYIPNMSYGGGSSGSTGSYNSWDFE